MTCNDCFLKCLLIENDARLFTLIPASKKTPQKIVPKNTVSQQIFKDGL